jgi:hypothetical protein
VSKREHAAKIAQLHKLSRTAESMHVETARLVALLSIEARYARSTASLRPKPRKSSKP